MNKLREEKSPYLQQHAHNPVKWYPWGEEAFTEARKRQVPLFISIGYSTCYWCHVMEKDSFEHEVVAQALEPFVCVKVDREERPDVDTLYMDFVVGLQGHGGWPLSVFVTPELVPFWGGTFFRRDQFISILGEIASAWQKRREEIVASATTIHEILKRNVIPVTEDIELICPEEVTQQLLVQAEQRFDPVWGGFGQAPKFPPTSLLPLLRSLSAVRQDERCITFISTTLSMMARGGLYDLIGGGFSRYATDKQWIIPHFEKMLYDNALLLPEYIHQRTRIKGAKELVYQTISYLDTALFNPRTGLYYSAQDAGEVDKEGEYYVWSYEELSTVLSEQQLAVAQQHWGVTPEGNFEGTCVLTRPHGHSLNFLPEEQSVITTLSHHRSSRRSPSIDYKCLADWNALMLSALVAVAREEHDMLMRDKALALYHALLHHCFGQTPVHRVVGEEGAVAAMLDDYAFMIAATLDLYECTFEPSILAQAQRLFDLQHKNLYSEQHRAFAQSCAPELVVPHISCIDGATPNGNAVTALNALRLWHHTEVSFYREIAEGILCFAAPTIKEHPFAVPTMVRAFLHRYVYGGKISFGDAVPAHVRSAIISSRTPWQTVTAHVVPHSSEIQWCSNLGTCEPVPYEQFKTKWAF